jgi:hypothetical protein
MEDELQDQLQPTNEPTNATNAAPNDMISKCIRNVQRSILNRQVPKPNGNINSDLIPRLRTGHAELGGLESTGSINCTETGEA